MGIGDASIVINKIINGISTIPTFLTELQNTFEHAVISSGPTLVQGSLSLKISRSGRPTGQPSSQPSITPTSQPSSQPTSPTSTPTSTPTKPLLIVNGSINVFISFGSLFGFIAFITIIAEYQHGSIKIFVNEHKNNMTKPIDITSDSDSDADNDDKDQKNLFDHNSPRKVFNNVLIGNLKSLFDGIFSNSNTRKTVIEKEFEEHHLYFSIIYSQHVGLMRWLKAFKLFSSETIAVVFICLFYSYQSPRSYNCHKHKTLTTCLDPKSLLDSTKQLCKWTAGVCSINDSVSFYDHVAFIIILCFVMQGMGLVNFILDIAINDIICAPAYIEEDDIQRSIDRNEIRSKSGKIVQDRMIKMIYDMRSYRKYLFNNSKTEDLKYFDDQWGVTETLIANTSSPRRFHSKGDDESSVMTKSLSSLKKKFNIRNSEKIARDMFEIVTLSQEYSFRLQDLQDYDCSLLLLYIFILDLLGRDSPVAKIYAKKVDLFRLHKSKVPLALKFFTFIILLGGNTAAIYYTSLIASMEDVAWNRAVLICALGYLFLDFLIFESAKLFWIHLMIPSLITPCTLHVEKTILSLLNKPKDLMAEEGEGIKTFSATDYVFVSSAAAQLYPEKPESALILSYKNPYPEQWVTWSGSLWHKILVPTDMRQEATSVYQVILFSYMLEFYSP